MASSLSFIRVLMLPWPLCLIYRDSNPIPWLTREYLFNQILKFIEMIYSVISAWMFSGAFNENFWGVFTPFLEYLAGVFTIFIIMIYFLSVALLHYFTINTTYYPPYWNAPKPSPWRWCLQQHKVDKFAFPVFTSKSLLRSWTSHHRWVWSLSVSVIMNFPPNFTRYYGSLFLKSWNKRQ